jgi:putative DNA primase/helicase
VIRKDLAIRFPGQFGTSDNLRETAVNEVMSLCALNRMPKADAPSYLLNIGDLKPVNPVMDFILSQPWDGVSRFHDLLATVQTRPGFDRDWMSVLMRRWLVSAVAAAAKPSGFFSKGVLVFQGPQSSGKTAWFRALLPEGMRDLLKVDAHIDPDNKDSIISAVSHWLVELGELDGTLRKADIARLKGFISQDVDQFRRPYARAEGKYGRRTVFFASVNPEEFLADDTGSVRWWTIPVTALDYSHSIEMQQLWAEVYGWFEAGEQWWLDPAEEICLEAGNSAHAQAEPVEELIQSRYGDASNVAFRSMTATDVLIEIGYDKPTRVHLNKAANALREMFGEPKRTKTGRFFNVPALRNHPPF